MVMPEIFLSERSVLLPEKIKASVTEDMAFKLSANTVKAQTCDCVFSSSYIKGKTDELNFIMF